MKNKTTRILTMSLFALVTFFFVGNTFAAYEGYLTIKGGKQGKTIKVQIAEDGTFKTPPLGEGTYTYSFSWGVGRGIGSPIGGSKDRESSAPSISEITISHEIVSPRDHASGLPTGKRQHGEVKITKEWGPSSPMVAKSSSPILIGSFTVDDDCDGITGTVALKDAKGAPLNWDLAPAKKM